MVTSGSRSIFVPTNTLAEWDKFVNFKPADVSLGLCPINGSCSGTPGTCALGTVAGDNGAVACNTTRTWSCNGSNGGTNASCSTTNAVCVSCNLPWG
jgi:hypothetical protein